MKIHFDKVYCVSYCRNIEKQNNIRKVMKYLGINFEFIYGGDFSSLYILKNDNFNLPGGPPNSEKEQNFKYYSHFLGSTYNHYTAVMHAYESGLNSVLIIEDDCEFINDISYINWALNNYPKDADYIKFGYWNYFDIKEYEYLINDTHKHFFTREELFPNLQVNEDFNGSQFYGICNRKTMVEYIKQQSSNLVCCDLVPLLISESTQLKYYGLIKPLCLDSEIIKYRIPEYKNQYNLLESIS